MVWLKLYMLIAARFIFHPSKVSINFTVCCLSIAVAFNFLLGMQQYQCNEQPLWQLEPGEVAHVPASQAAVPARKGSWELKHFTIKFPHQRMVYFGPVLQC